MAYTQPILGGASLPNPAEYKEQRAFRGAMTEMADGSVVFDVVDADTKKLYTLTWKTISNANKVLVEAVYDALKIASAAFTPPTGAAETNVTRTDKEIEFTVLNTAAGLRWNVSMELREV